MESVIVTMGMIFVGIIIVCLAWTILNYIADAYDPNNKLEENMKKFDVKKKNG
jgi:hypothetical protein